MSLFSHRALDTWYEQHEFFEISSRVDWMDVWRGIGILLVVVAHIWRRFYTPVYWFHIPMFFVISGMLFRVRPPGEYLRYKTLHLMVPYFWYLVLLSLPLHLQEIFRGAKPDVGAADVLAALADLTLKKLYGGDYLVGWFGIFWFVTCLFLTQQIYNLLRQKLSTYSPGLALIMVGFYVLAYWAASLSGYRNWFWRINTIPYAIVFFYLGDCWPLYVPGRRLLLASFMIFLLGAAAYVWGVSGMQVNMAYGVFGLPVINMIIAVVCCILVQASAQILAAVPIVGMSLRELGRASMLIMFLHLPLKHIAKDYLGIHNALLCIIIAVVIPYGIYQVSGLAAPLRLLFRGQYSSRRGPPQDLFGDSGPDEDRF